MTGSTDDTFTTTVGTNGATSLVTVDTAAAAANLTITADGTVDINSTGDLTLNSSTDIILDAGTQAIILKDDGTQFGKIDNNSSNIRIYSGTTLNTSMTGANTAIAGNLTVGTTAVANTDTDTSNTGNVTLDFSANQNFVLTLTGNTTLVNPSTEQVGQSGFIAFIQDGTGSRTVSLGTDYETAGSAGLTLTSTASATDLVPYLVVASGRILLGTPQLAFG